MAHDALRLFRRPLSSDPLLRLWLAALCAALLTSAALHIDFGSAYSAEIAGDFLQQMVALVAVTFLLVAWLPALVRWVLRYGVTYPLPRAPRREWGSSWDRYWGSLGGLGASRAGNSRASGSGTGGGRPTAPRRNGVNAHGTSHITSPGYSKPASAARSSAGKSGWTNAAPLRSDIGARPGIGRLQFDDRADDGNEPATSTDFGRAPDLRLDLQAEATVAGQPVRLTWRADGADYVTVEGVTEQLPASGSVDLFLDSTRDISVSAFNSHGESSQRTALVRVLPVPVLHAVRFPGMGDVKLRASVDVGLAGRTPVLERLEQVMRRQDALREQHKPVLASTQPSAAVRAALRTMTSAAAVRRGWRPSAAGTKHSASEGTR